MIILDSSTTFSSAWAIGMNLWTVSCTTVCDCRSISSLWKLGFRRRMEAFVHECLMSVAASWCPWVPDASTRKVLHSLYQQPTAKCWATPVSVSAYLSSDLSRSLCDVLVGHSSWQLSSLASSWCDNITLLRWTRRQWDITCHYRNIPWILNVSSMWKLMSVH